LSRSKKFDAADFYSTGFVSGLVSDFVSGLAAGFGFVSSSSIFNFLIY
jgi:hypothetical protein